MDMFNDYNANNQFDGSFDDNPCSFFIAIAMMVGITFTARIYDYVMAEWFSPRVIDS